MAYWPFLDSGSDDMRHGTDRTKSPNRTVVHRQCFRSHDDAHAAFSCACCSTGTCNHPSAALPVVCVSTLATKGIACNPSARHPVQEPARLRHAAKMG